MSRLVVLPLNLPSGQPQLPSVPSQVGPNTFDAPVSPTLLEIIKEVTEGVSDIVTAFRRPVPDTDFQFPTVTPPPAPALGTEQAPKTMLSLTTILLILAGVALLVAVVISLLR